MFRGYIRLWSWKCQKNRWRFFLLPKWRNYGIHLNERYNELWYSPDGATAIRVILLMRCSGRHWLPKQKQTWDAVLRTQMQQFWRTQIPQWGDCQKCVDQVIRLAGKTQTRMQVAVPCCRARSSASRRQSPISEIVPNEPSLPGHTWGQFV